MNYVENDDEAYFALDNLVALTFDPLNRRRRTCIMFVYFHHRFSFYRDDKRRNRHIKASQYPCLRIVKVDKQRSLTFVANKHY